MEDTQRMFAPEEEFESRHDQRTVPVPGRRVFSRGVRSNLRSFFDHNLDKIFEYEYSPLKDTRKRIRLVRLFWGDLDNPTIDCELFEVAFNERYVPIKCLAGKPTGEVVTYTALSWCWGTEEAENAVSIRTPEGKQFKLKVKKELALALKYLRKVKKDRILWIDAICIDQANHSERNHQVEMMAMIYTRAKKVCVWLGEDDMNSNLAIRFIRNEIMHLERFDTLCKDRDNVDNWNSLLSLMQRKWFRRRWVVQEIALARKAKIYCGVDKIAWKDFAVAVELFVEVESATHRLSEVLKKDERFYNVPGWFDHVSELGASRLVNATAKVFRAIKSNDETGPQIESANNRAQAPAGRQNPDRDVGSQRGLTSGSELEELTVDPLGRRGLLSLEYLVSTLSTFEATEPQDAIYSLLAIARDTSPFAETDSYRSDKSGDTLVMTTLESFLERKPYRVDYSLPFSDVCKDFISFCIKRSQAIDPTRALDILCRPWAPPPKAEQPQNSKVKKPRAQKGVFRDIDVKKNQPADTTENKQDEILPGKERVQLFLPAYVQAKHFRRTEVARKESDEARDVSKKLWEEAENTRKKAEDEKEAAKKTKQWTQNSQEAYNMAMKEAKRKGCWSSEYCTWTRFLMIETAEKDSGRANGQLAEHERVFFEPLDLPLIDRSRSHDYVEDTRSNEDYWAEMDQSQTNQSQPNQSQPNQSQPNQSQPNQKIWKYFPGPWRGRPGKPNEVQNENLKEYDKDIDLPTWVASIKGAPFELLRFPGMSGVKRTGRKNADSLVGLPHDHRTYSAGQTHKTDQLKFCKRPIHGHCSLYVKGFIFDMVQEVAAPAYGGNIPKVWTTMAGWEDLKEATLPDAFVRTLVADRGKNNRNPPYYYNKACLESMTKGSIESGRVNIEGLINNEQNSIITEFSRRVQEVIWNRCLIKTANGRLGLVSDQVRVGDLVCIIYGCSVPVILRKYSKLECAEIVRAQGHLPIVTPVENKVANSSEEAIEVLSKIESILNTVEEERQRQPAESDSEISHNVDEGAKKSDDKLDAEAWREIKNLVPTLKGKLMQRESAEEVSNRLLKEYLDEEDFEDRVEKLKAFILRCETRFVQRARYRELVKNGWKNQHLDIKGNEWERKVKNSTKIVNIHLRKMKKTREYIEQIESEAKEELSKIVDTKEDADDGSKEDDKNKEESNGEKLKDFEQDFEDKHFFYQVMGESYIHGMMDGDAIRERFERNIREREFELR